MQTKAIFYSISYGNPLGKPAVHTALELGLTFSGPCLVLPLNLRVHGKTVVRQAGPAREGGKEFHDVRTPPNSTQLWDASFKLAIWKETSLNNTLSSMWISKLILVKKVVFQLQFNLSTRKLKQKKSKCRPALLISLQEIISDREKSSRRSTFKGGKASTRTQKKASHIKSHSD